jgi:hypothetical protein
MLSPAKTTNSSAATTHKRCHNAQRNVKMKPAQANPSGTKITRSGLRSGGSRTV